MTTRQKRSVEVPRNGFWFRCGESVSQNLWPLTPEQLCAEARRRAVRQDFGDPEIETRLAILTESLQKEADLHPLGRLLAWTHLCDLLETRLRMERLWEKCRGMEQTPVERPIFITGMPRSGSTFLHELLAQDTALRAPRVWEVMRPVGGSAKVRMRRTAACLWWFRRVSPEADSVHPIRAATPHECVAIHSYTLLSREFLATFRIPAYERYVETVEFDAAYAWQKKFLQHLQWRRPTRRWVLKAPDHVFTLEALMRVFPDAVIIHTHRNPLEVLESSSRLTEVVQRTFARPQERREIGIREARVLAEGTDRISRFREKHTELSDRILDVRYDDLVSNPAEVVRRLYRQLDLPLTPGSLNNVNHLAATRSRYGPRKMEPCLAELGIDFEKETERFAGYCERFGIRQF